MTGTIINFFAIIAGAAIGLLFGAKLPEKMKETIISGLGIFVSLLGVSMFIDTTNSIICLGAVVIGTCLGEWWNIEGGLEHFGDFLQSKFASVVGTEKSGDREKFVHAFLTASLLYLIGPMAVLGAIQDGLSGNSDLLIIKSILDGITAIAFASTMGIGVGFAGIPIIVYQGLISLLASQAASFMTDTMITELSAAGGVLLVAVGIGSLLNLKKIRVGNMLPSLIIAPLIVWIMSLF